MPDLSPEILLNFDTGSAEHTARRQLLADGPGTEQNRLENLRLGHGNKVMRAEAARPSPECHALAAASSTLEWWPEATSL